MYSRYFAFDLVTSSEEWLALRIKTYHALYVIMYLKTHARFHVDIVSVGLRDHA